MRYGWRGRLGAIMPDNNTVLEPEMGSALPIGVSLHGGRALMRGDHFQYEQRVSSGVASLPPIIEGLRKNVDVFCYACMTTSLFQPVDWQNELAELTQGRPFLTAGNTIVAALRAVGAGKIGVFSPFYETVASRIPGWFGGHDIQVVHNVYVPFTRDQVTSHSLDEFMPLIRKEFLGKQIDALAVLATDLPSFDVIDLFEEDLGLAVISSNLALLWCMLGVIGVGEGLGIGKLSSITPPSKM